MVKKIFKKSTERKKCIKQWQNSYYYYLNFRVEYFIGNIVLKGNFIKIKMKVSTQDKAYERRYT